MAFEYLAYGTDKQLHPRIRSDGSTDYVVSPYQMAAREGKYYLICNFDKYDDISNYRMDRIRGIRILDQRAKPFESLQGADGRRLDLADYMKKHAYMFSSGNCRAVFRVSRSMIGDVRPVRQGRGIFRRNGGGRHRLGLYQRDVRRPLRPQLCPGRDGAAAGTAAGNREEPAAAGAGEIRIRRTPL